jgi:hypothetical protein
VPDQLPAEPAGFLDDLRMVIASFAVQRGAGATLAPPGQVSFGRRVIGT